MEDGPYRGAALVQQPPRSIARARPRRRSLVLVSLALVPMLAGIFGIVFGLAGAVTVLFAAGVVAMSVNRDSGLRAYQRAVADLDTLAFRIVIDMPASKSEDRYVERVIIRLGRTPSLPELERLAGDAHRIAPMLAISSVTDTTLELVGRHQLSRLAELLTTWGCDLHDSHHILEAYVSGSRPSAS